MSRRALCAQSAARNVPYSQFTLQKVKRLTTVTDADYAGTQEPSNGSVLRWLLAI